ncbi:MAG: PD40 domain-containing protein [Saprospiraceae bacterium]|nr:PD40 domain-containing protein [Saprospiraceae bacterium]
MSNIAFTYGGDVWVADLAGQNVLRITSTPAVESHPVISPDGNTIAFTSNRDGNNQVYTVNITGGMPKRLTWHPMGAEVRGWTPDGLKVLYASARDYAPRPSNRLWVIPKEGGVGKLVSEQRGFDGSFSQDGNSIVLDVVSRWESEFRGYRGGQNTPLVVLNLRNLSETLIPCPKTIDIHPVWIQDHIYFMSDRQGGVANIWSYHTTDGSLHQLTNFTGADIKWLAGNAENLIFEREGRLHLYHLTSSTISTLSISIIGDFPWAAPTWEEVSDDVQFVSLSAKGKRVIMESRGEIFTIPAEYGETRNLTNSPSTADRKPIWSPNGDQVAWFSDEGHANYVLKRASQDGMTTYPNISIGESKYAWEPTWSPDGHSIAFVDDDLRVRLVDLNAGTVKTIGMGGINIERGNMGLAWSPDSKWLAYTRAGSNNFEQIMIWSATTGVATALTNSFANAFSPAWDLDGRHMYFLASTNVALGSGWTNTSAMTADPEYAVYVVNLQASDPSPFQLRSDEEEGPKEEKTDPKSSSDEENKKDEKPKEDNSTGVRIDFDQIDRRIIPLPLPNRNYAFLTGGPEGTVFIAEDVPNQSGLTIHKFALKEREGKEFLTNARQLVVSSDRSKLLVQAQGKWNLTDTKPEKASLKPVQVKLDLKLDRMAEWNQMFEEAWRYEKDYFYDPNLHGRNWDTVYHRYAPLIPFVKHRSDLNYIFDQVNGELSVGHSFVFGGDYPDVAEDKVGLLGADLRQVNGRWRIVRIYTTENWNPELTSPLDQPGLKVQEGNYLLAINGLELTANDNVFERLDGTRNKQTVLTINDQPSMENSWTIVVEPIRSEVDLRQRAWVEDNRKLVDRLSDGKLAYVWVPNTSGQGLVSFNRYFFAQQDKLGAVIDERYNGGGLLDDYMVDLMTRNVRAAYTNEIPGARPRVMPAGILGPKVLLINEMSGSGGDFFPWVFRHQQAGPLIGTTTWGGLVKSSVHYRLVDGGALTAPDNAIFDPAKNEWIAENKGIPPDIEVRMDTKSISDGTDPQLERAVQELMKKIDLNMLNISRPPFSKPALNNN